MKTTWGVALAMLAASGVLAAEAPTPVDDVVTELVTKVGEATRPALERGVSQVRALWRPEDGDEAELAEFVRTSFVANDADREVLLHRLEDALESLDGHFLEMERDLGRHVQLDLGPILPIDERLAAFSPSAHLAEDLFRDRIGFVALLNFPLPTLEEKLAQGESWSRRQWAEVRLAERFATRLPAPVAREINHAFVAADSYVSGYNVWMHHLLDGHGKRPFPAGLKLISHWGLRDELKAQYALPDGLARQRMIATVMERIVRQEIPAAVIDDPRFDWDPIANRVSVAPAESLAGETPPATGAVEADSAREPDARYRHLLAIFRAERSADPYDARFPTFIARRFGIDREMSEERVRSLFESILTAPLGKQVGRLIAKRLERRLEPFDIWYAGFQSRSAHPEAELDRMVGARYPTVASFQAGIPDLLGKLGFDADTAAFLAERIVVDPSRGAGHALGAERRGDQAHLRTRIPAGGMRYKGFNIAVHELGHNVEQTFSLDRIDEYLLHGVPNTAFTEALAFLFQGRDLELLGFGSESDEARSLRALDDFWATREIAGVALVDMGVWHWMYDHPAATPAELRGATLAIARDVWNRYFADTFGRRDVELLAVYSHMIDSGLYLPDYPLGHLIAFQVGEHFRGRDFGREYERVCRLGRIPPDMWMKAATGQPVSAEPLVEAAKRAYAVVVGEPVASAMAK